MDSDTLELLRLLIAVRGTEMYQSGRRGVLVFPKLRPEQEEVVRLGRVLEAQGLIYRRIDTDEVIFWMPIYKNNDEHE